MTKKKKVILIVSIVVLAIILGISLFFLLSPKKQEKPKKKKEEKTEEKVEEVKQLNTIDINSNKRPIAIMIDNNVGPSNHAGLQDAYVSYEAIVEGGLTRIMVIFKDKTTSLIGPIRSSRHYFLDYALEHDAIYAHFGWSPYAKKDIKSLGVNNINGLTVGSAYWRDQSIAAPHNVFTSIDKLYESASSLNYQTTSDNWEALNLVTDTIDLSKLKDSCKSDNCDGFNAIPANNVVVPYSGYQERSYTYDSNRGVYLRFMNGNPHADKTTKEQYHYKNIIIQRVDNKTLDEKGRQDLTTVGSGDGYYITNGYALPITWKKTARNAKTTYTYQNGEEIKLNDGNTFIQIEPSSTTPTIN